MQTLDATSLLTTLVQSGAALVAIIAGLLVARLVALAGERTTLQRQVDDAARISTDNNAELAAAQRAVLADDIERFLDNIVDVYIPDRQETFDSLYDQYGNDSQDQEKVRPFFVRFATRVDELYDELGVASLRKRPWPSDWEKRRAQMIKRLTSRGDQKIAEEWLAAVESSWSSYVNSRKITSLLSPEISAARMTIRADYRRDLLRRRESAEEAVRVSNLELALTQRALKHASRPEGLGTALAVVAGIALGGIALPLVQLTFWGPEIPTELRGMYTGIFLASLVVFFAYMGYELRRLGRPTRREIERESGNSPG